MNAIFFLIAKELIQKIAATGRRLSDTYIFAIATFANLAQTSIAGASPYGCAAQPLCRFKWPQRHARPSYRQTQIRYQPHRRM
jgi:hypothetical protein